MQIYDKDDKCMKNMKSKVFRSLVFAIFAMLAFTMQFETEIIQSNYASLLSYYKDRLTESLFTYHFSYYFLIPLFAMGFYYVEQNIESATKSTKILGMFFSVMYVLGVSFRSINSWDYYFLDVISILKFFVSVVGYYIIFLAVMRLIIHRMDTSTIVEHQVGEQNLLSRIFSLRRTMPGQLFLVCGLILVAWLPFLVLSYPGGLCVDVSAQIEQALGNMPFSTQHAILYTLFLKLFLTLGQGVFHSYGIGLFMAICSQTIIFALVLSYSIYRLIHMKIKRGAILVVFLIYCLAPIYSNLATTAIKDTLYGAFLFWFVIELARMLVGRNEYVKKKRNVVVFITSAILMMLMRNNGVYVGIITFVIIAIYLLSKKMKWGHILIVCVAPVVGYFLISSTLAIVTNASGTSSQEILSIPFQQTARYMTEYPQDITQKEMEHLNQVFADVWNLSNQYDPNISDPIKRSFNVDASRQDVVRYIGSWVTMGLRHPLVYVEAFLNHVYGWFDPGTNNWIRYQARMPIFPTPEVYGTPDLLMYYIYNFLNRMPVIGLLENVGIYVWGMLLMSNYIVIRRKKALLLGFVPLYVSLLICVASPAFFDHPRYGLPIMVCMPFLWIVARLLLGSVKRDVSKHKDITD